MNALVTSIKSNLYKEYIFIAYQQIEKLDEIVYDILKEKLLKVPKDIYKFIDSEQITRCRVDIEYYNTYMQHIEDFSRDWSLYDEGEHFRIYNKPNFESDITSFTFGGDFVVEHSIFRPA